MPPAGSPLGDLLGQVGVPGGTIPAYPPPPHCNTRGLTDLGRYTVRRMMDLGMIVNPDHMSQRAVDETLTLAESRDYSGVISPHGWMDPRNWPRIFELGGMAFPGAGAAEGFVDAWRTYRPRATPHYFGWGYGADLGGLATQGAPSDDGVTYPFKSLDGRMTVERQRTGERTFDYSREGVAHYGLYAEWYEDARRIGGARLAEDMLRGPEAYLQMWERSVGIPAGGCKSSKRRFVRRGLGPLRIRTGTDRLLRRAGQPLSRKRAWTYCVDGKRNAGAAQTAVMTRKGRVGLVASTARGQRARGIGPGATVKRLRGRAKRRGEGLWTARLGRRTVAYVVKRKRVRTVALAARKPGRSRRALRRLLAFVPRNGIESRPPEVVNRASARIAPQQAVPEVAQRDGAQFPMYCGL